MNDPVEDHKKLAQRMGRALDAIKQADGLLFDLVEDLDGITERREKLEEGLECECVSEYLDDLSDAVSGVRVTMKIYAEKMTYLVNAATHHDQAEVIKEHMLNSLKEMAKAAGVEVDEDGDSQVKH